MTREKILTALAICLFLLTFPKVHYSQSFAPTGAVWHYSYFGNGVTGYLQILSEGDTLIYGKASKKLKKIEYVYNYFYERYDTTVLGYEYVYSENNKVFNLIYDSFYALYDFNAEVDSTWEVAAHLGNCDSTGRLIIDSVSSLTIGATTLKEIYSSPVDGSHWMFPAKLVERMGCFEYMFPYATSYCGIVSEIAYQLRCYQDTVIGLFETGVSELCDYIPGLNAPQNLNPVFTVSPTVITDKIHILFEQGFIKDIPNVEIIDLTGKELFQFKLMSNADWYDFKVLAPGIYLMSISSDNYSYNKLIVKL